METGVIKMYNPDKHFGFIRPTKGPDVHFSARSFHYFGSGWNCTEPTVGLEVTFSRSKGRDGRETAGEVYPSALYCPIEEWTPGQGREAILYLGHEVIIQHNLRWVSVGDRIAGNLLKYSSVYTAKILEERPRIPSVFAEEITLPARFVDRAVEIAQGVLDQCDTADAQKQFHAQMDSWVREEWQAGNCPAGAEFRLSAESAFSPILRQGQYVWGYYAWWGDKWYDFGGHYDWEPIDRLNPEYLKWHEPSMNSILQADLPIPVNLKPECDADWPAQPYQQEEEVEIVNLCPHAVNLIKEDGSNQEWPKAERYVRLDTAHEAISNHPTGLPVQRPVMGAPGLYEGTGKDARRVADFPAEQPGVFYVVPGLVRSALPERKDLLSPSTDPKWSVRDSEGRVTGTRGFDSN